MTIDTKLAQETAVPVDDTGLMLPPKAGFRQNVKDRAYWLRASWDDRTGRIAATAKALADRIDWSAWQEGRPTVLCFSRATFNKDIAELRRRAGLNFVEVKTTAIKAAQEAWIPPEWRVQTYFTGLLNDEIAAFRPFLLAFGRAFLEAAGRTHRIDAMMAANSDYWQDEAMRIAGWELNIPFLTLCRENYTIPQDQKNVTTRLRASRFRYNGSAMAVYSQQTKETMGDSGSYAPDHVFVTGAPRFDRWRDVEMLPFEQRDCITLISFASPFYYAPVAYRELESAVARGLGATDKRLRVILKIKKQNEEDENRDASPQLVAYGTEIVADWSLFELFPRSKVVIGYNSLAVAEGLLGNVPVVIPNWGDAIQPGRSMFEAEDPLDRRCIYFPSTPAELEELVRRAATVGLPPLGTIEERRRSFSKVIEAPSDTTSSALVEAFIRRYLPRQAD